jgi:hypothetical protein
MSKYPTPLVSDTERGLIERQARYTETLAPMVIRLHDAPDTLLSLPHDLTLSLIRRRKATLIPNLKCESYVTLTDEEIEESGLEVHLWADPMAAQ